MSDYLSLDALERVASVETGIDFARVRREDRDAAELCDWIEEVDAERAADEIEQVFAGYCDPLTRIPYEGFESPRFLDSRQRAYRDWLLSREGARTRANAHPSLEARLRRAGHADEPASFAARDEER